MTSYRHVVAREQRTRESQSVEHREDDHWRIKSSGLCSRRGNVEHRVECGQFVKGKEGHDADHIYGTV
jgi:hypothetical protein